MPVGAPIRQTDRLARVQRRLSAAGVEAVVLARPENVRYVSGFVGSAGFLVVTPREAVLVLDSRYFEQAGLQAPDFERVLAVGQPLDAVTDVVARLGPRRLGVEEEFLPVGLFRRLAEAAAPAEVVPVADLDAIRSPKFPDEIAAIGRANAMAETAFGEIAPMIRPGAVERDIAVALEERLRRLGAERPAFDLIVASGPRSALPHAQPTDRVIGPGEFVTIDFGAVVGGYHSDCTRTLLMAPATDRHREVYRVVLEAQQAALRGLRAGLSSRAGDALARTVIAEAGWGEAFGHGLGHGVGLAVHEGPRLSRLIDTPLEAGAVVTVEPGIYLAGWGGVRIEDLVVITDDGIQNLTTLPKDLIEVTA